MFCGNLTFTTTEETIKTLCEEHGEVKSVRMARDPRNNNSKGFCYVEFETAEEAIKAVTEMNQVEIDGRPCRVEYSVDKETLGSLWKKPEDKDPNAPKPSTAPIYRRGGERFPGFVVGGGEGRGGRGFDSGVSSGFSRGSEGWNRGGYENRRGMEISSQRGGF